MISLTCKIYSLRLITVGLIRVDWCEYSHIICGLANVPNILTVVPVCELIIVDLV